MCRTHFLLLQCPWLRGDMLNPLFLSHGARRHQPVDYFFACGSFKTTCSSASSPERVTFLRRQSKHSPPHLPAIGKAVSAWSPLHVSRNTVAVTHLTTSVVFQATVVGAFIFGLAPRLLQTLTFGSSSNILLSTSGVQLRTWTYRRQIGVKKAMQLVNIRPLFVASSASALTL